MQTLWLIQNLTRFTAMILTTGNVLHYLCQQFGPQGLGQVINLQIEFDLSKRLRISYLIVYQRQQSMYLTEKTQAYRQKARHPIWTNQPKPCHNIFPMPRFTMNHIPARSWFKTKQVYCFWLKFSKMCLSLQAKAIIAPRLTIFFVITTIQA